MELRKLAAAAAAAAGFTLAACGGGANDAAYGDPDEPGSTQPPAEGPAVDPDERSLVVFAEDGPAADAARAAVESAELVAYEPGASVREELVDAINAGPDAIVAVGPGAAAAVDSLSAEALAQPFVVLGAQLPEPTQNVTAVVWDGADERWDTAGDAEPDWSRLEEALGEGLAAAEDEERAGHVILLD